MRLTAVFSLSALLGSVVGQYLNQTGPFKLQLVSDHSDYNGQYLAACHEGAAIESLCPTNATVDNVPGFYYNYSDTSTFTSTSGYLTYLLQASGIAFYEPLSLNYNPTSNVAVPLFTPSDQGQLIAFDDNDLLYIPGGIDDTQSPINPSAAPKNYYRWYVCTTYSGYVMQTLAWTLGEADPQNPTCCPVSVKRVSS